MLDALCQHAQAKRLNASDSLFTGTAVRHPSGKLLELSDPSPIRLLLGLNGESHDKIRAEAWQNTSDVSASNENKVSDGGGEGVWLARKGD